MAPPFVSPISLRLALGFRFLHQTFSVFRFLSVFPFLHQKTFSPTHTSSLYKNLFHIQLPICVGLPTTNLQLHPRFRTSSLSRRSLGSQLITGSTISDLGSPQRSNSEHLPKVKKIQTRFDRSSRSPQSSPVCKRPGTADKQKHHTQARYAAKRCLCISTIRTPSSDTIPRTSFA